MNRILYPDGTWAAFTYEGNGNVLTRTRETGFVQSYTYDSLDRIIRIQGREVRLSYNPLRQLEELEDWLGTTRIENDALGRAVKVSYPEGETVSYSYGKAGERTSLTYPDGRTITYGYDELSRLTELRDGGQSIRYAYDAQGRLEEKRFPGGMTSRYAYDDQGRIESLIHSDREGILDAYAYKYDILGNKTAIEKQRRGLREESGSYAYGYDALGRLSSVTKDGTPLRSYAYDAFGNRTGLREGERERETRYTYNALNQLVSLTDGETTEEYAYDKRGNLTEHLTNGTLVNRYMYGALNRLEKAVNGEGVEASYQYNGLGYRTGRSVRESLPDPEKQIRYTIDLTRQYHNLLQKEEEGEILSFLWDGGAAGMRRTGGLGAEGMRPESQEYYLQDDLGSPIRLLSESGEVTESYGYDEFGRDLYGNQGEMQPFGYTGYQYDRVSDTYFAQAREYVPGVGRFVGQDIILGAVRMPITMNRYSYCFNNGLILVDLNGAWPATRDAFGGLKGFCQNIDKKLYDINQGINRGLSTLEQELDSMLDGIERGLDNISDGIGKGLDNIANGLERGLDNISSGIEKGLYNVKTEIKNTANDVAEEAKKLWENNKSKVDDFMYENKAGIISALAIVVAGVFGFATGGAGLAIIAVISSAASGGIGGILNLATGGNFINGFAGGAVTTTLSMTGLPIWAAAGIGAAVTTVLNNTDVGNAWYLDVLEKTADAMALAIILPFSKIGKLIDVPLNGVEGLVMNYFLQVYEAGVNLIVEFIEEIKKSFFRTSVKCDVT